MGEPLGGRPGGCPPLVDGAEAIRNSRGTRRLRQLAGMCLLTVAAPVLAGAQEPAGLAANALANPDFTWIRRNAPGLRIHFLVGSYPAAHQDSLVARTAEAKRHGLAILGADAFTATIDVFFVDSRPQMEALVGARATGFADMDARAIFLMTNPEWRAFERHEMMHVLARHVWGRPAEPSAWLQEGLAQFTDGRCAGYPSEQVLVALAADDGYTSLDTLVSRFRQLHDLTAYLQAASVVEFLYRTNGREAVRALWTNGVDGAGPVSLAGLEAAWRRSLPDRGNLPAAAEIERIRQRGCG